MMINGARPYGCFGSTYEEGSRRAYRLSTRTHLSDQNGQVLSEGRFFGRVRLKDWICGKRTKARRFFKSATLFAYMHSARKYWRPSTVLDFETLYDPGDEYLHPYGCLGPTYEEGRRKTYMSRTRTLLSGKTHVGLCLKDHFPHTLLKRYGAESTFSRTPKNRTKNLFYHMPLSRLNRTIKHPKTTHRPSIWLQLWMTRKSYMSKSNRCDFSLAKAQSRGDS